MDEERALRYLTNISYYQLCGYWGNFLTPARHGQFPTEYHARRHSATLPV